MIKLVITINQNLTDMNTTSIVILGIITGCVLIYLGALFLNAIFNKEE